MEAAPVLSLVEITVKPEPVECENPDENEQSGQNPQTEGGKEELWIKPEPIDEDSQESIKDEFPGTAENEARTDEEAMNDGSNIAEATPASVPTRTPRIYPAAIALTTRLTRPTLPPILPPPPPPPLPLPLLRTLTARRRASAFPRSTASTSRPQRPRPRPQRSRRSSAFDRMTTLFSAIQLRRIEFEKQCEQRRHELELERLRLDAQRLEVDRQHNELLQQLNFLAQRLSDQIIQRPPGGPSTEYE